MKKEIILIKNGYQIKDTCLEKPTAFKIIRQKNGNIEKSKKKKIINKKRKDF